jgi:hypothetical protein
MKSILLRSLLSSSLRASVLGLALIGLSTTTQAGPVLAPVGPRPLGEYEKATCGYLKVYSATEANAPSAISDGDQYYPHSAYWIYNAAGKRIRTVQNHGDFPIEGPDQVALNPGTYTVRAWSDSDGLVTVPVIIKVAQTTSVHLEDGRADDQDVFDASKAVKSPSGQIVGWKA